MALQGYRPRLVIVDEIAAFAAPQYCEHGNDVNNDCPGCETERPKYRGMEGDDQLVEIDGRYGYAWRGDPLLEVGDLVVLPSTIAKRRRGVTAWWVGQVTDFGSSWTGTHVQVLRIATEDDVLRWAEVQEAREMARPKRERFERRGS